MGVETLALPPLLGPVRRALRLRTRPMRGVPRLRGAVLEQRRGAFVRRVPLRGATVELVPARPGRLLLRATAGRSIEVELLRVRPGGGRSQPVGELLALADAVPAGPVALALREQAAYLSRGLALPDFSPLAAQVGRSGTRLGDIADGIGSLP
ncbi:hypothetical protein [Motilibacter aurantiacus]|uniref:hypothetical protein n=1 Tax=Motilibacter aurantiacus TaxID=2714955 RepID=UPI00140E9066|nr:hypothetical protein [Motilibacter aurantiacus]NHC45947.1 hypothetical protein [Motilibacter aurantiacus]